MWPSAKPVDEIGNKIKSYIKDISNLIDEGMKASEGADEEDEDDDDDENMEEVPSVPETDENSKQAARDDEIEDDALEESKGQPLQEENQFIEELALPAEPFRLDELRISAPMLRNELSDSLAFFENMLIENYGNEKFRRALSIVEKFERDGQDRYTEQSENQLVKQLEQAVFKNNEGQARQFLYESSSYLLIKNTA